MYISHKSNVIQYIHELEWNCRRKTKGLSKSEYWIWLASVTSGDPPVVDYSGETGYTIVECTDEDVQARLSQLGDYVNSNRSPDEALVYNIKYYTSKRDAEEIKDFEGNSHDPKQYVQSHFVGQDDTKDARLLAEQWTRIRAERDRLLTSSDWTQGGDSPCTAIDKLQWKTYREELRDIPKDQSSETTYEDITWPTKPF
jgi:hypothetical protein